MKKLYAGVMFVMIGVLTAAMPAIAENQTVVSFSELSGYEFGFSSGVGAWGSSLEIHEDGSFEGGYHDTDMGSNGDGYDATIYCNDFSGTFGAPVQLDEYTYAVEITSLTYTDTVGAEWIEDRVRYVATEPYGLEDTTEMYIYIPGCPVDRLPDDIITPMPFTETVLTDYAVLNPVTHAWFAAYPKVEDYSYEGESVEISVDGSAVYNGEGGGSDFRSDDSVYIVVLDD